MDCPLVFPQASPGAAGGAGGVPAALLPPARSPYHQIMYGSEGSEDSQRVGGARDASSTLSDLSRRIVGMALGYDGDDDLSVDAQPVPAWGAAAWDAWDAPAALLLDADADSTFELEDRLAGCGPAGPVPAVVPFPAPAPAPPPLLPATSWLDAAPFVPGAARGSSAAESASATPGSPQARRRHPQQQQQQQQLEGRPPIPIQQQQKQKQEQQEEEELGGEVCLRFCTGACTRGKRCRLLHIYERGGATARDGTVYCRSRCVDACLRAAALVLPPPAAVLAAAPRLAREPSGCLLLDLALRDTTNADTIALAPAVLADARAVLRCAAGRRALLRAAALAPRTATDALLDVAAEAAASAAVSATDAVCECALVCAEEAIARNAAEAAPRVVALFCGSSALVRNTRACRLLARACQTCSSSTANPALVELAGALGASDGALLSSLIAHGSEEEGQKEGQEKEAPVVTIMELALAASEASEASTEASNSLVLGLAGRADVLLATQATARLVLDTVAARVKAPGVAAATATALVDTLAALVLDAATAPLAERLVRSHDRAAQRTLVHALIRDDARVRAMLAAPPAARVLQAALVNITARQYLHLAAALRRHADLLDATPTGRAVAARMTRAVTNGSRSRRTAPSSPSSSSSVIADSPPPSPAQISPSSDDAAQQEAAAEPL